MTDKIGIDTEYKSLNPGREIEMNTKKEKKEILAEFNEDMKEAAELTLKDLEGLIDAPDEVDDYINNRRLNLIDAATKTLGWTWEELEDWHNKNWI